MRKPHKIDRDLMEKVLAWRAQAIIKVKATKNKKRKVQLARDYYEADQSTMDKPWPEMEKYVVPRKEQEEKQRRDRLIIPTGKSNGKVHYPVIQKKHLPTLEQYRKLYGPHIPEEKQTGKGRRFTGHMLKNLTQEQLFKETFPELLDENGNLIPREEWNEISTRHTLPQFLSYEERKNARKTTTELLSNEKNAIAKTAVSTGKAVPKGTPARQRRPIKM